MSVQLILKNSSVQDKVATASQLEIGEIALNYHESGPFLQCKDTAGHVWRIGGVIVADVTPGHPQPGTWWFKTDTKGLYFYDGTVWTEITGGGGGGGGAPGPPGPQGPKGDAVRVIMQDVAPAAPVPGDLWFNTNNGQLYAWYDDGSSKQWVSISHVGAKGDKGDNGDPQKVVMSATPPATPVAGDLWFNTNRSTLYAFYNDGSSSQWVSI